MWVEGSGQQEAHSSISFEHYYRASCPSKTFSVSNILSDYLMVSFCFVWSPCWLKGRAWALFFIMCYTPGRTKFVHSWTSNMWLRSLVTWYWLRSNIFVFNPEPDIPHPVQCQRLFLAGKLIYQNIKSDMESLFYVPFRCLLYTQMTSNCTEWWVSWGVPQVNVTRHTLWIVTK